MHSVEVVVIVKEYSYTWKKCVCDNVNFENLKLKSAFFNDHITYALCMYMNVMLLY